MDIFSWISTLNGIKSKNGGAWVTQSLSICHPFRS